MTGGNARDELVGADQLLLSIVLYIYPNASADELCALLWWQMGEKSILDNKYQRGVRNWSWQESIRWGKHMILSWRIVLKIGMVLHSPLNLRCPASKFFEFNRYWRDGLLSEGTGVEEWLGAYFLSGTPSSTLLSGGAKIKLGNGCRIGWFMVSSRCWREYPKTKTVDSYIAGQLWPIFFLWFRRKHFIGLGE